MSFIIYFDLLFIGYRGITFFSDIELVLDFVKQIGFIRLKMRGLKLKVKKNGSFVFSKNYGVCVFLINFAPDFFLIFIFDSFSL